jgi:hypothetical protein
MHNAELFLTVFVTVLNLRKGLVGQRPTPSPPAYEGGKVKCSIFKLNSIFKNISYIKKES